MFDIITFGTATKDVFIKPDKFSLVDSSLCFSLGSKIAIKEINFSSGGGGTNTAVTFAKQGFSVSYCGKIGEDHSAEVIKKELVNYGVDCSMISTTPDLPTNHSVIISIPDKDRTILVYRGASQLHKKEDVDFSKIDSKWIYLAPLSDLFYSILEHSLNKGISVMVNPGVSQIKEDKFKESIKDVKVLLLNKEEASLLTGESDERKMILAVSDICNGVILITKGKEGVVAFFEGVFYEATPSEILTEDHTGAGDSFGAGFLSAYIKTGNIEEGVILGIANSSSCLQKVGAKKGLLNKEDNFNKVDVKRSSN